MKQYQISYKDEDTLHEKLAVIKFLSEKSHYSDIIFYLTWTKSAQADVETVTKAIVVFFPDAPYYGNEASGNIAMGRFTYGINIACCVFEEETSRTELVWVGEGSKLKTLSDLWKYCGKKKDLKGIELIPAIASLETLGIDRSVPEVGADVLIFGGASVNYDDATYGADIIAKGRPMTREGMAVMLYCGKELSFRSDDILGWKGLGKQMTVTKSKGKLIEEIDDVPAYSIYEKYLNLSLNDRDTLVFPLIAEEDGREFIRTPQIIGEDRSMLMFADIPEGTRVRISYGDKNTILESLNRKAAEIAGQAPDAIKAYSCAARRLFWGDEEVGRETEIIQKIAPVCGFYTGGEILRFGDKLRVLNQTLALVSLSEGKRKDAPKQQQYERVEDKSLLSRLTFFAEKIVEEEKEQRIRAEGFEDSFKAMYQVMYYIDLEEGHATFLYGDEDAKKFMPILSTDSLDKMFENFNRYYIDTAVVPEDREKVREIMNAPSVYETLKTSHSMSVNYRVRRNLVDPVYTEMSIIKAAEKDGVLSAVILAFRLTEKELRKALETQKKLENDAHIINAFSEDYGCVDYVEFNEDKLEDDCIGIRTSDLLKKVLPEWETTASFSKKIDLFISRLVYGPDRDDFFKASRRETIIEKIGGSDAYYINTRLLIEGEIKYYQVKISAVRENGKLVGLVAGTRSVDEYTRKELENQERLQNSLKEAEKANEKLAEQSAINSYFLDPYESAYYICLKDLTYQIIKCTEKLEKEYPVLKNYIESLGKYINDEVYPEDRDSVSMLLDPEGIRDIMSKQPSFSFTYREITGSGDRYKKCEIVRGADSDHAAFGFRDINDEVISRQRKERQEKAQEIMNLASSDEGVFLIDCANDTRKTVHDALYGADNYDDSEKYSVLFRKYVENMVAEPDREMMRRFVSPMGMLGALGDEKEVSIRYRDMTTGSQRFYEMKIFRYSETEVLQSFSECDAEMINSLLLDKIKDNYFAILGIDLESELVRSYKEDPLHIFGGEGNVTDLSTRMMTLASRFEGETREFFERNAEASYIKEKFANEDRAEYVYRSSMGDGTKWAVATGIVLSRNESGEPSLFCMAFHFLDKEAANVQDMQERLGEALESAQSANKAKTDFLFNMSHDIRTPMNAIIGFTNMAMKHIDDRASVVDSLKKTQQAGELLLSLINDILDMSRIESGKITLDENEGDVYLSFASIASTMDELARAKNIDLSFKVEDISDRFVYADFSRCMRVFVNIITNSIKYTNYGGCIKVRCRQTGRKDGYGLYTYTFEDNGIGMSEEFQKRMFDEFAREETATISGIQGTGLGLTVCKSFVDAMGGTIDCRSRLGEGTTFTVTLPLKLQEGTKYTDPATGKVITAGSSAAASESFDFSGKKALLVEDNELNREIAVDILSEEGIDVDTASDGSLAVQILNEKGPDAYDFILMDIQMPIMDGYEATRAIRAMYPKAKIPIIALSANAFEEDRIASLTAGMNDHVAKPINIEALRTALAKYL